MYEVWLVGNKKLEKYRCQHISSTKLRKLVKSRADVVKVVVWSDREVSPIQEMEV